MNPRASRRHRFLVAAILMAAAVLANVSPAAGASSPEGAYVTTLSSGLFAYGIDSTGGALTPLQGSPFPAGQGGFGVTPTPDRRHLYVSNYGSHSISAFDVGASGALSAVHGSPFAAPQPVLSAATPNGRYLYVANDVGNDGDPGSVSGYGIDSGTGKLTPVPGSPVRASDIGPFGVAVSPDGNFLYVSNTGNSPSTAGSVSVYRIAGKTGRITEIAGSPYGAGIAPAGVAMTPDGDHLYVANGESATISAFTRDSDSGALTPVPNSPFSAGNGQPAGLAITPDGRYLYSASGSEATPADNRVHAFAIDPGSGALAEVKGSPYPAGFGPQFAAITGDGAHLYVTNNGSQDVSAYAIDASSGALTELPKSPFATGDAPLGIAISKPPKPSNQFSFGKLEQLKQKGKARMSLSVPGPGLVKLAGKGVKKRKRHVTRAAPRFLVASSGGARQRLRSRGHVSVKVKATYRPDGGTARTETKHVKLIRR
jgi:6-phosphogluconolactonase